MVNSLLNKKSRDKINCFVCAHNCFIPRNNYGICGVRKNIKDVLKVENYGKVASINIDPIEKKPLFHFLPGESTLSFGNYGCNFRCENCQNYEISQVKDKQRDDGGFTFGSNFSADEIIYTAKENDLKIISATYNEPTISLEFVLEVMKKAKEEKMKNAWVSNGYMSSETIDLILPYLDGINIDIKSMDEGFYKKRCGASLKPILDNCEKLIKKGVWVEISTLIIPKVSDDMKMLEELAEFIYSRLGNFVPWHLNGFSPEISWKMKDYKETEFEKLKEAYDIGKKAGLKYVYVGNVSDSGLEDTYCFKCGEKLIERKGYYVNRLDKASRCNKCESHIEGVFK